MSALLRSLWQFEAEAQGLICAFTPDEQMLIAGAEDGTIYAFDYNGRLLWRQHISGEAFRFAFSRRSNILAIGTIRGADTSVLNFETGELLWRFSGGAQTKAGVGVTEDGERIFSGDDDGKIRCFARDGDLVWQYRCDHRKISRLSVTPDGRQVVFGGNDYIYCLDGRTGELLWRYRTGGEVWAGARILPDGSRVIGGSNDQHVYMLDRRGSLIWRYKLGGNVNITYPTPDGAFIAAGSTDSCAYLLSGEGQLLWKYRTGDSIYGVSVSENAEFVAVASYDRCIYLFNREGSLLEKVRTGNQVYVVDITSDGRYIGSFGFDKRVYLLENCYAARTEAERAEVHNILRQRVINQVRNAFVNNLYYGLCYWFDQFNQLLRRSEFDLCDALIAEARQESYPFTPAEQRFVDSREGAIQLKRGIAAQRKGNFNAAETFYKQAIALQRKAGCSVCESQAQLALRLLNEERLSGQRDPLLDKTYDEVMVLGGGEALLTARLATAPPDHLPLIIRAATKTRLIKPLLQALKSDNRRLQMLAIATLNRFSDIGDVAPILAALRHESPFVRWQAASILSRQKNLPPEFAQALPELIAAERDPDARRILVEIAAHLKIENLTPLLIPLLENSDNDLRWSTVIALGKVGDRRALPALRKTVEGYTLFEHSIHDALQRAIREIDQRYPLPKLNNWSASRLYSAERRASKLYWRDEAILFTGTLSNVKGYTRLSFVITSQERVEQYRLTLSYAEFAARTERLKATLGQQVEQPFAPPSSAPVSAATAYEDHEEDAEDEDDTTLSDLVFEEDEDEQGEEAETVPEPPPTNAEAQSGALWVLLSPEQMQTWREGTYTASLYVLDEATGLDEPIGNWEFTCLEQVRIESARLSLSSGSSSAELGVVVEYVQTIYLGLRLVAVPLGTELRAEVWYGTPDSGSLVLSESRLSTSESDTNLQFQFQQPRWPAGTYTIRFLARGAVRWARTFQVEPYTYDDWRALPNDTPYLWDLFGQHLLHTGRGRVLVQTVKEVRYLVAKTALCKPEAVEADLNLACDYAPNDAQLAALRHEYRRIHHILEVAQKGSEIAATLALWLGNVPELRSLVEAYEQSLEPPRLIRWHDLPAMHPALLRTLRGHLESTVSCAYSPDGKLLATTSEDRSVRLWNVQTGYQRIILRGADHSQRSCAFSSDGKWLISSSWQKTQLWDIESGSCVRTLSGHNGAVVSVAFHPNSRQAISAGSDGTLRLWDVLSGEEVRRVDMNSDHAPTAIAFTSDGALLCSVHQNGELVVWHAQALEPLQRHSLSEEALYAVAISPDDEFVAVGSKSGRVMLMPLKRRGLARQLSGHANIIHSLAFSPDGEWLVSASADSKVRLWRWRSQDRPHVTLTEHLQAVRGVAFSPDGSQLATVSADRDVKIWDVQRLTRNLSRHPRAMPIWYSTLSQDGHFALSDDESRLVLWDVGRGESLRVFSGGHTDDILGCAISPDNRWAVSGGQDRVICLWELPSGKLLRKLEGHTESIWRCAISPDGRWFVSASADQTLRIWEFPSGVMRFVLRGHNDQVNGCAISPDGRYIASAGSDGTVRVWLVENGREYLKLDGHSENSVLTCVFSPDGRYLASGGYDKRIKLWSMQTGRSVATLEGHTHNVQALAFSPNGRWLLSGARNGGVRLWQMSDYTCQHSVFLDRGVTSCAFLPDGERVLIGSGSGLYLLQLCFA